MSGFHVISRNERLSGSTLPLINVNKIYNTAWQVFDSNTCLINNNRTFYRAERWGLALVTLIGPCLSCGIDVHMFGQFIMLYMKYSEQYVLFNVYSVSMSI